MSSTNQYIRQVLHHSEPPPPVKARFFYTSPLAIDDPLSPLPPPATSAGITIKQPPRPFSEYDNTALDKAWNELRHKILKYNEERGEKSKDDQTTGDADTPRRGKGKQNELRPATSSRRLREAYGGRPASNSDASSRPRYVEESWNNDEREMVSSSAPRMDLNTSMHALDGPSLPVGAEMPSTTGRPFARAPSRKAVPQLSSKQRDSSLDSRPEPHTLDSYNWDVTEGLINHHPQEEEKVEENEGPTAKVAVGVSRLHQVVMPNLQMEPIYWAPVHDIAPVTRGTWFYKDTMLPVETPVANMLEAGYVELQPWTETWRDELNSAIEVGAAGEMKILHKLWPEQLTKRPDSRPGTSQGEMPNMAASNLADLEPDTPGKQRERAVEAACDIIDISSGVNGPDNKAAGSVTYSEKNYPHAGVIYANVTEAHILKPNLQPSTYYGRRPLANYIRKGRKLGVAVVRGFDQAAWDRLYPPKKGATMKKAQEGVSSAQSGAPPTRRQKNDPELARSERPKVTELVLVIHGIGQKLSERMESFHFTHAINAFRREVNVELGTDAVKAHLRKDMGGIMVLPVCAL